MAEGLLSRLKWVLLALVTAWYLFGPASVRRHPPGVLVTANPAMEMTDHGKPWTFRGYLITPLAHYHLKARVLAKARYWMGRETDLSKYDLAVGWGIMSDQRVLDELKLWQSDRWYSYEWPRDPPAIPSEIATHSKNMHLIASTDFVARSLDRVVVGDVLTLDGSLIEAKAPDGWSWRSSLDDNETGAHSCKVYWVETVSQ